MDIRDVGNIQKRTFGAYTKLIHGMAKEIECLAAALRRKRCPVVVTIEPDGEVNVYGELSADVEIRHWPVDWQGATRDAVERYIDTTLPERHRWVHNMSSRWCGSGSPKYCRSLDEILDALEKRLFYTHMIDGLGDT